MLAAIGHAMLGLGCDSVPIAAIALYFAALGRLLELTVPVSLSDKDSSFAA